MTKYIAIWRFGTVGPAWDSITLIITTRTSWMANNAMPDSIIMNMIRRNLGPSVELNDSNVCSTEEARASVLSSLTSKNTVKILNTIKLVSRAFTTMDAAKAVRVRGVLKGSPCSPSAVSQVARGNKLISAYQMDIFTDLCIWLPKIKE